MYTITRPERTLRYPDGKLARHEPAETRTFHTAAGLFRFCLNERIFEHRIGGRPYPSRFTDKHLGRDDILNSVYGIFDTFSRWQIPHEYVYDLRRAQARYAEIIHYLREVEPEWRPDTERTANESGIVHFADNSTERHEINKYGQRRSVMLAYPSGDVCF